MIESASLRYFKAFEDVEIDFKPITVLLGPNNSGKSSLISPLRMLSQTVDSYDNNVPLLLNGNLGDFGTYRDVVNDNETKRHIGISLSFDLGENTFLPKRVLEGKPGINLRYNYRTRIKEIILNRREVTFNGDNIIETEYNKRSDKQLVTEVAGLDVPDQLKSTVSEYLSEDNFIPRLRFVGLDNNKTALSEFVNDDVKRASRLLNQISAAIRMELEGIEYVGAMRAAPSRTYLFTGERRQRVGSRGQNAVNILAMDSRRGGSKSKNIAESVGNWLQEAEMGKEIQIKPISDRHYELRITHPTTHETQNFADTGYGHSQVLPVLVAGENMDPGDTLMVEQPEIHLHPRAQAELGDFFLGLQNGNKTSIIETHSEHLIIRLQRHVAQGNLSHEDISFYYVYPKGENKRVKEITLDENARFNEEWPEGFFPEKLDESRKLAIERD